MITAQKFGPRDNIPWARHFRTCTFEGRNIKPTDYVLYVACMFKQCIIHHHEKARFVDCWFEGCEFYNDDQKLSPEDFLTFYPNGRNIAANGDVTD